MQGGTVRDGETASPQRWLWPTASVTGVGRVTVGSLCAITGLLDNTSEPLPATLGACLEQCPLKGTCCFSQEAGRAVSI